MRASSDCLDRPTVLGKINRVVVGIVETKLGFSIFRSLVDSRRGSHLLADRPKGLHVIYLKTEMIDPLLYIRSLGFSLGLERQNGQIDMAVRKIGPGPTARDNLETEDRGVKLDQAVHVFRRDSDVANASHNFILDRKS